MPRATPFLLGVELRLHKLARPASLFEQEHTGSNFGSLRIAMKRVDDFRLRLGNKEYVPIMIGGMGVDISTSELALEAARLGGIGHISDAMVQDVSDRK